MDPAQSPTKQRAIHPETMARASIAAKLLLAGLLLTGNAAGIAQQGEPAPAFVVGDTWNFERLVPPDRREPFSETVEHISPEMVLAMLQPSGRRAPFSPVMNPLDKDRKEIPWLRFPMSVGNKWQNTFEWQNGKFRGITAMDYKVVAIEDVVVPAGKFRAYRIVANGWVKEKSVINTVGGDIRATETIWYAPAAKRVVKFSGKHLKWIPAEYIETWSLAFELKSYKLESPSSPAEAAAEVRSEPTTAQVSESR